MLELVFDNDWEHTHRSIVDPSGAYIAPGATFLNPRVADEDNNWANRGALLHAYRQAAEVLRANRVRSER